jgi:hypothetical protein
MPFSFHVDERRRVLHIRAEGVVNDQELIALSAAVRNDPAFMAGYPVLHDCSAVTDILLSSSLIYSLAMSARAHKNPVALIAPGAAAFGLARMYQILSDVRDDRVRVFADADGAIAWLKR